MRWKRKEKKRKGRDKIYMKKKKKETVEKERKKVKKKERGKKSAQLHSPRLWLVNQTEERRRKKEERKKERRKKEERKKKEEKRPTSTKLEKSIFKLQVGKIFSVSFLLGFLFPSALPPSKSSEILSLWHPFRTPWCALSIGPRSAGLARSWLAPPGCHGHRHP